MKKTLGVIAAAVVMLILSAPAQADTITFDGLQNVEPILNFYNGGLGGAGSGPGPNFGVTFSSNAVSAELQEATLIFSLDLPAL